MTVGDMEVIYNIDWCGVSTNSIIELHRSLDNDDNRDNLKSLLEREIDSRLIFKSTPYDIFDNIILENLNIDSLKELFLEFSTIQHELKIINDKYKHHNFSDLELFKYYYIGNKIVNELVLREFDFVPFLYSDIAVKDINISKISDINTLILLYNIIKNMDVKFYTDPELINLYDFGNEIVKEIQKRMYYIQPFNETFYENY